ncbi:MAG: hypothetical protein FJ267_10065 [Planctomycetes bacterium]|nr:hypothetical protein [Planctomycetota bacterium]
MESVCSLVAVMSGPIALGFVGTTLLGQKLDRIHCYQIAAGMLALISIVSTIVAFWGTSRLKIDDSVPAGQLFSGVLATFRNHNFLVIVVIYVVMVIANRVSIAQIFMLLKHFHGRQEEQSIYLLLSYFAGSLGTLCFWVPLGGSIGPRKAITLALVIWPIAYGTLVWDRWVEWKLCFATFVAGASYCGILVLVSTLIAETIDRDSAESKESREGLYASATNLALQIGLGFGYFLTGVTLQAIGYQPVEPQQPDSVVTGLRISVLSYPLLSSMIALAMIWQYRRLESKRTAI